MNLIARLAPFAALLLIAACAKEPAPTTPPTQAPPAPQPAAKATQAPAVLEEEPLVVPAPSLADLPKVLGTIKDGATATAAKGQLDSLVQQLQTAKAAAPANAAGAAKDALGGIGKLAGDAAAKLGVSPDTVAQISTLLANPAIKAAIGPTLEKLQSLVK